MRVESIVGFLFRYLNHTTVLKAHGRDSFCFSFTGVHAG